MMKKKITLALLAIAGMLPALAAPVSQQRASDIALAYVANQRGASAQLKVASIELINDGLYLVNFAPKGFALVSTDDNAEPVFGYSTESNLRPSQMPENMAFVVKEASDVVALQSVRGSVNPTWRTIENGTYAKSRANGEPVDPLIKVNWNQTSPYNAYCPGEGSKKAIVGCVAVAMSQAMSVQRYPDRPQGQVTYSAPSYGRLSIDFDKEAPYKWDDILSGANRFDEAARLMYHAGMSVEMGYGADGSGIPSNQVYRISNALRGNFGYGPEVTYYWRKDYRGDWEELLLNELYAGRAIVYNAIDSKGGYGHSFNVDGYNGRSFHINWGWGSVGNGYFDIDRLQDAAMNMNYDSSHVAVIGIGATNSPLRGIHLVDQVVDANQPAGTIVSTVLINGELPGSDVDVTITGEYDNVSFKQIPFEYKDGQILTTRSIDCSEGPIYVRVVATMKGNSNTRLVQGFNVEIEEPQPVEHRTSVKYERANRTFTVHTKYNSSYSLKRADGTVIISGKVGIIPDFEFTRDQLAAGTNVLEITCGGSVYKVNIVK